MPTGTQIRPHAVFVGCPWRTIRPKYERIFNKKTFKRRFPISFVIIGRDGNQRAEDLFAEIKRQIDSSSCAILDVSGGNSNVALEFGYVEGKSQRSYVFVNVHQRFAQQGGSSAAIISDLSGLRRNPYKNEAGLKKLLIQFAQQHPYCIRVVKAANKLKASKKVKAALMSIPRAFTSVEKLRRADLMYSVMQDSGCDQETADKAIEYAKKGKLIEISVGQYGYTTLIP